MEYHIWWKGVWILLNICSRWWAGSWLVRMLVILFHIYGMMELFSLVIISSEGCFEFVTMERIKELHSSMKYKWWNVDIPILSFVLSYIFTSVWSVDVKSCVPEHFVISDLRGLCFSVKWISKIELRLVCFSSQFVKICLPLACRL